MTAANPIQAMLDDVGLPWRTPRAKLMSGFQVKRCSWLNIEIVLPKVARPLVSGLIRPLEFRVWPTLSKPQPPVQFLGVAWWTDDAAGNLARAKDELSAWLGAPEPRNSSNTFGWLWRYGAAEVKLLVWPPELQRPQLRPNNAHQREPKLITGCHIDIQTGYKPAPTVQEQAWLDSYTPLANFAGHGSGERPDVRSTPASEYDLEFVREPGPDLSRFAQSAGRSADGKAFIFCHEQLYLVPMALLKGLSARRVRPARGSGGAWLYADCKSSEAGGEEKRLKIAVAPRADDLNDLAERLARGIGKPFDLGSYQDDD